MYQRIKYDFAQELVKIKSSGLFKDERTILSAQKPEIRVEYPAGSDPRNVLNFCANNYLGLANHPKILEAARKALDEHGFGLASVRFICGTQDLHKILEQKIAEFFHTEDTILYSSCFDANGGLFETLLGVEDAVVTDALNHASIIDGIRLCKAKRFIYDHADMASLEKALKKAREGMDVWDGPGLDKEPVPARNIMIITDGVFSMDGDVADIRRIVELGNTYDTLVVVDDSHGTGVLGATGRGSVEEAGMLGQVDIITSTLGKAMGGATGGFVTGHREIIEILRQKSRPYLFSNTIPPVIAAAGIAVFDLLAQGPELREKLRDNTVFFRGAMKALGFDIIDGSHPIVPVMFRKFDNDARLAQQMARELYAEGIYVVGFVYPVVPKGQSRIRVQISAAHSREQMERAVAAFEKVGRKLEVI
ncbi:MAG TPA: glycine C-acetyltransferase [Candidatus Aminicenantes bacterium]|mgnify:FL=1|nr:glycine C-acetyltransferase [Candidatus Aminicenantes bacterium]